MTRCKADSVVFLFVAILSATLWVTDASAGGHIKEGEELKPPEMTQAQMDGVRAAIDKFANYSDEKLLAMMARLGNEHGRLSDDAVTGRTGILVLAHHFYGEGYEQFKAAFKRAADTYPVGYGFGLSILTAEHLQAAVNDLQASGAETIVVLPATTAEYSMMVQQWRYALVDAAQPGYIDIDRVQANAELVWASSPVPHPIYGEILLDHALAESTRPENELVLILGHGPANQAFNIRELTVLDRHAAYIKREGGFYDVRAANVQDDAPVDVRAANVERIRAWVTDAKEQGRDVIVVTTVLTAAGVMTKIENDVADLGVRFSRSGTMTHPRFPDWLDYAIGAATDADKP